jgi:DoxX-like family
MNFALWIVSGFLALVFAASGGLKLLRSRDPLLTQPRMAWGTRRHARQHQAHRTGGGPWCNGLVLPRFLGLIPVLTPIAAGYLALLMRGAVVTHVWRHESSAVPAILGVGRRGRLRIHLHD